MKCIKVKPLKFTFITKKKKSVLFTRWIIIKGAINFITSILYLDSIYIIFATDKYFFEPHEVFYVLLKKLQKKKNFLSYTRPLTPVVIHCESDDKLKQLYDEVSKKKKEKLGRKIRERRVAPTEFSTTFDIIYFLAKPGGEVK